jgi:beta-lactamase regulating signal transducer with metallopeptidase domain
MSLFAAFPDRAAAPAAAHALIHFLWQGAGVAILLALANLALRRASARARYAAACAALVVLCVLPAATFARLRVRERTDSSAGVPTRSVAAPVLDARAVASRSSKANPADPDPLAHAAPWIVAGWLAGVGVLSLRFFGGFVAARRLTRRHVVRADSAWQRRFDRLASRLGVPSAACIRLLESAAVRVPTVVGVLRPVVLIPAGIATGMPANQLESLLAHELAHIRRRDALVSLLQAVAETLLFYHPAVWWTSACIRIERENACDDLAVEATGDAATHARALLEVAALTLPDSVGRRPRIAPAFTAAADGGRLWSRIVRLVAPGEAPLRRPGSGASAVLVAGAVLVLGAAARVPTPDPAPAAPAAAPAPAVSPAPTAPPAAAARPARPAPARRASEPGEAKPPQATSKGALSPDDLVAFRIHGVTPEFIAEISALGYAHSTPDELVALRIHGVTPEYAREMTAIFGAVTLDDLVAFRIHGVTPESARSLKALFGKLSPDDAVALRIHGADPEFVQGFRDAGYASLSADDAVALRIHGATPELARALRDQGLSQLSADDLVAFRIHGVTPQFVAAIRGLGYDSLDPDDLVAFRIHGVTPEWIRSANQRAGERLSPDDLVHRRIHARRWSTHDESDSDSNSLKEEKTP